MSEEVAAAVFGNVGSLVSFQVGIDDAKIFSEQFDEERILPIDLASLPKYEVYNRIMVDGLTTPVFSGKTLPPPELTTEETLEERVEKIQKFSRQRYAKPREVVEDKINRWARPEVEKRKKDGEGNDPPSPRLRRAGRDPETSSGNQKKEEKEILEQVQDDNKKGGEDKKVDEKGKPKTMPALEKKDNPPKK